MDKQQWQQQRWLDGLLAGLCLLIGTIFAYALAQRLGTSLYGSNANNVWFQADLHRTLSNMIDINGNHYRTKVHPIASLTTISLTSVVQWFWPGTPMQGALQLQALAAGLWATGLYVLGRRLAAGRLAALAFTGLGVSSAAFMFWFSVAETYGLGSLTILAVLLVAVGQANQPPSGRGLFAANALSLSMTVTNWMAGLALTIACVPWRKAIRIALGAVAFVAVLALIQKWIIPTSKLFFLGSREELMYMGRQESGGVIEKLKVLLLYGFAMPQIDFKATGLNSLPLLSVQFARLGSSTVYALPALLCWTCLLSLGVWGALRTKAHVLLVRTIALTALGQIVLHLIYGEETFLYVLHLMPVMVALAMLSMLTPCRIIAPWLAVAAMVFSLANNTAVFSTASEAVSATVRQPEK